MDFWGWILIGMEKAAASWIVAGTKVGFGGNIAH
jgi:hypothetical protein